MDLKILLRKSGRRVAHLAQGDIPPVRVGVVGCGAISGVYLKNSSNFPSLEVRACSDLEPARATSRAAENRISRACSVDELLLDPSIEVILNLTVPAAHAEVSLRALLAGKSVYGEKPLAVEWSDGLRIMETAREKQLRVGSAPDTFLGSAQQTARAALDEGEIGQPLAAHCFMLTSGVESWHPNPGFYYKWGGGPMFDMGPYYLSALVNLFGPVRRVTGSTALNRPERTITSQPFAGRVIQVEVPTHVVAVLEHRNGVIATLTTSFDVRATSLPNIEVYGTEGSMIVPDPNSFGGDVEIRRTGQKRWLRQKSRFGYSENSRGLGLADMATAMRTGAPHRASGELALHVLEIMHAVITAAKEGRHIVLTTAVERPEPMPSLPKKRALSWLS